MTGYCVCRFTNNDTDLPPWFSADESKHWRRHVAVSSEALAEYRDRAKEIDSRPIKKIAEAKARKKVRPCATFLPEPFCSTCVLAEARARPSGEGAEEERDHLGQSRPLAGGEGSAVGEVVQEGRQDEGDQADHCADDCVDQGQAATTEGTHQGECTSGSGVQRQSGEQMVGGSIPLALFHSTVPCRWWTGV